MDAGSKSSPEGLHLWLIRGGETEAKAIEEFMALSSDRATGIVATAYLEDKLTSLIRQKFIIDDADKERQESIKNLFRDGGTLGSLGAKIHFAFAVGLLSPQGKKDFSQINKIRNHFAHVLSGASFNESPIRENCLNIKLVETFFRQAKDGEEVGIDLHDFGFYEGRTIEPNSIALIGLGDAMADPRSRFLWAINLYALILGQVNHYLPASDLKPYL
jgi:hypothetical protein